MINVLLQYGADCNI